MTKSTHEDPAHALTVQEAVTETVQRTPGHPPKAIAQDVNLSLSVLYDIADPFRERRLRAEEIPALVKATGNYLVLDVIERRVGRVGFRLPPAGVGMADEVLLAREAIREFSEALEAWTTAHADGRVTADELAEIDHQADEAIAAIVRMKASAHTRAMGGVR